MSENDLTHPDQLRTYLNAKPGTTEGFPFGPEVVVYKLMDKIYALLAWGENPVRINLKCDPDLAVLQRGQYPAVLPGYHMNKKHWNTVVLDGSLSRAQVAAMIDHSYELIRKSLKKDQKAQLAVLEINVD